MSVTINELRATEEMLIKYFTDIKVLNIWKASICSRREYKKRLEAKVQSGIIFNYMDNVKSPILSKASPSNRQPPKGLDICIDKAGEIYDKLIAELQTTELDIMTTEEGIERLEQSTMLVSEVIKSLSYESKQILELKLYQNKTFEDIADITKKSKSAVHDLYRKILFDVCKWLKYINAFEEVKK